MVVPLAENSQSLADVEPEAAATPPKRIDTVTP